MKKMSLIEKCSDELLNSVDLSNTLRAIEHEADNGNPELYFLLGCTYQSGEAGNVINHTLALQYYEKGFTRGDDPISGYELARIYFYGFGDTPIDFNRAFSIVSKIAYEHGYFRACFMLAHMIENGLGTSKNSELAIKYYHEAYIYGCIPALGNLGRLQQCNGKFAVGLLNRIKAFSIALPYIIFKRDHARISYI